MTNAELKKISKAVSKQLHKELEFVAVETLKGGFQADAFKVTAKNGETFFVKKMKVNGEAGFELPERHLFSYAVGHGMAKRAGVSPAPVGLVLTRGEEIYPFPHLDDETSLYHVQSFAGDLGEGYFDLLQKKIHKKKVDAGDVAEIEAITDLISSIHNGPKPSKDLKVLNAIYNDSLQSVVAYPGMFFMFLSDFGAKHFLLPRSKHGSYVSSILNVLYSWENLGERLRPLHGDFWGSNVFINSQGKATAVDFSRIPYGEPGIDVGYFVAQYLWFYHETGNLYFKKLGELFIKKYSEKSGDKEIRNALCVPMGLLALLYINPRFHPDNKKKTEKTFFETIVKIIKAKKFLWGKIK